MSLTRMEAPPVLAQGEVLEDIVKGFPAILERLRESYAELEQRAQRVEGELNAANRELAEKVRELDGVRRHLQAVVSSLPCGVVVRDPAGRVTEANTVALGILGTDLGALRATGDHPWLAGEHADGSPIERVSDDGRRYVLTARTSRIEDESGETVGTVEILDDRTENANLEERLFAADKLASLGTMAAGIAHEIRNPMNAISGFAALLAKQDLGDEKRQRWARLIVEGSVEADAIIQNMLTFGSPERLHLETIDGEELLASAIELAVPADRHDVQVTWRAEAPGFAGDRIKLRQAVRNLVANAVGVQETAPRIDLALTHEGDEIVLRVSDAGPGLSAEVRRRAFDPFFTTRAEGTGLGLALVSAIASVHGGGVHASPEPSPLGGAQFTLRFPFLPAQPPADPLLPSRP